jgi:hypothetical protein
MMSAEFVEAQKQFEIAKKAAESIRVRAWSVYLLVPHEEDGSKGARFCYQFSKPTLDEALGSYYSRIYTHLTAFVVEEYLAADNTRYFVNEADDTRKWTKCAAINNRNLMDELSQSPEGYIHNGKKGWVHARITSNGIEDYCAEAIALEPKPTGWKKMSRFYMGARINIRFPTKDGGEEGEGSDEE